MCYRQYQPSIWWIWATTKKENKTRKRQYFLTEWDICALWDTPAISFFRQREAVSAMTSGSGHAYIRDQGNIFCCFCFEWHIHVFIRRKTNGWESSLYSKPKRRNKSLIIRDFEIVLINNSSDRKITICTFFFLAHLRLVISFLLSRRCENFFLPLTKMFLKY